MFGRRARVIAAIVLVAAVVGGWWWYVQRQAGEVGVLEASGMLEAVEVRLASERGGRLAERPVREGQAVQRGSLVATFDTDLLDHQAQLADAATRTHLERERERQTLRAPLDGWVIRTVFEPSSRARWCRRVCRWPSWPTCAS
jgi:HlyD family secretion protein